MTAEQILQEVEKLPANERFQIAIHLGMEIGDLRWLLCTHPDQEMVERSCLHFLGDAAQEWYVEWKKKNKDLFEYETL